MDPPTKPVLMNDGALSIKFFREPTDHFQACPQVDLETRMTVGHSALS